MAAKRAVKNSRKSLDSGPKELPFWRERGPILLLILFIFFWAAFTYYDTFDLSELRIGGVDPVGYYAWLRSAFFDLDFQFQNEYSNLNPPDELPAGSLVDPGGERTTAGHLPNAFSVGPAILWMPFFLAAHVIALIGEANADGFSQPYFVAVFVANTIYGFLGAVLTYYALRTHWEKGAAAVSAIAAWVCTSALYYTFAKETMSHACSFFAMALFLFVWLRLREHDNWRYWALIGAAVGLATLVRWQNAVFGLVPVIDVWWRRKQQAVPSIAAVAAGALVAFLPQMIAWQIVYGSFLTVPQGGGFLRWTRPEFFRLLLSRSEGLFLWTPLTLAGILGLFLWKTEHRRILTMICVAVILQFYIASIAGDSGWSFGARRLVNCLPFFAVGFATLLTRFAIPAPYAAIVMAVFAFWNVLFILQYGGILDPLYVNDALAAFAAEHGTTPEILQQTGRLPSGEPFDLQAFAQDHVFPRDGALSWKQISSDKLTVFFLLFE